MKKNIINIIASTDIDQGDAVVFGKRTWKERLFSWPWRPLQKHKVSKSLRNKLKNIAKIPGVVLIRIYEND